MENIFKKPVKVSWTIGLIAVILATAITFLIFTIF